MLLAAKPFSNYAAAPAFDGGAAVDANVAVGRFPECLQEPDLGGWREEITGFDGGFTGQLVDEVVAERSAELLIIGRLVGLLEAEGEQLLERARLYAGRGATQGQSLTVDLTNFQSKLFQQAL